MQRSWGNLSPSVSVTVPIDMTSCSAEEEGYIVPLAFRMQPTAMRRHGSRNACGYGSRGARLFVHIMIDRERAEMLVLKLAFSFAHLYSVQDPSPQDGSTQRQANLSSLWKSLHRHTKRCASILSKGLISPIRLILEISPHTLGFSV